jgi:hypothetical protein
MRYVDTPRPLVPKRPYLLQRIDLAGEAQNTNNRKNKIDYRTVKCVHGGVPDTYANSAINNVEEHKKMRSRFMSYDYMGSSEFEWGAVPQSYWRFLHSFKHGFGEIKVVDLYEGYHGQQERFWIFAPKSTMPVAVSLLKLIGMNVFAKGQAYLQTKEHLGGIVDCLFPETKPAGASMMRERDIEQMRNNELSHIGWMDIDNDYFVFWKRQDIAQAFSNLHDFGDVLSTQSELIDVSGSGSKLVVPDTREYWNAELATITQQFADMEAV